jgi:plasmid stabilization system protein ParE
MKYRFTDLAAADVRSIARFYARERRALGASFVEALYQATALVAENPRVGSPLGDGYRRVTLRQFPYCMDYIVDPKSEMIRIVAVSHQRRRPDRWKGRVEEFVPRYDVLELAA